MSKTVKKSTTIPAQQKAPEALQMRPARVDDVRASLGFLEDIRNLSESLANVISLFYDTGDRTLHQAATILDPIAQRLALLMDNEMPDLDWIRKDLVSKGLGNEILGGAE